MLITRNSYCQAQKVASTQSENALGCCIILGGSYLPNHRLQARETLAHNDTLALRFQSNAAFVSRGLRKRARSPGARQHGKMLDRRQP